MLKKLGKYMKGLGFLSLISALGMIIEAVCELALPSLANNIYETVNVATSPDQTKAYVLKMGFCMLGLALRRPYNHEGFGSSQPTLCVQA